MNKLASNGSAKIAIFFCIFFVVHISDANAAGKAVTKTTSKKYAITVPADIADFYCHTINIGTTPTAVIKKNYSGTGDIFHLDQQEQSLQFLLNSFFWDNLLVRHRKSDIIFPFHYFW